MHWVTMRAQYAAQYTLGGAKMVNSAECSDGLQAGQQYDYDWPSQGPT